LGGNGFAAAMLPLLPADFQPSPRRPDQVVCSRPECQAKRRNEYRRRKRQTDPEYAEVVRDSRRKWRDAHPDYQKKYWQDHPRPRPAIGWTPFARYFANSAEISCPGQSQTRRPKNLSRTPLLMAYRMEGLMMKDTQARGHQRFQDRTGGKPGPRSDRSASMNNLFPEATWLTRVVLETSNPLSQLRAKTQTAAKTRSAMPKRWKPRAI
jgi:hypothetical protein